jgi:hypothetical protein
MEASVLRTDLQEQLRWGARTGLRIAAVCTPSLTDPPGETTHWTAAAMAQASGISVSSVLRI